MVDTYREHNYNASAQHEAGKDWHPNGLHFDVLGTVLVLRSYLAEQEQFPGDPVLSAMINYYHDKVVHLKTHYGLTTPPPF